MLVLSRKVGQEIIVGDSVRITVTKVVGNRVTLGVQAPEDVRILRGELQPIVCSFEIDVEEEDSPNEGVRPLSGLLSKTMGRLRTETGERIESTRDSVRLDSVTLDSVTLDAVTLESVTLEGTSVTLPFTPHAAR